MGRKRTCSPLKAIIVTPAGKASQIRCDINFNDVAVASLSNSRRDECDVRRSSVLSNGSMMGNKKWIILAELAEQDTTQLGRLDVIARTSWRFRPPDRRRRAVESIRAKYGLSERQACRIVGQPRGTQRYTAIVRADEDVLTRAIISLASQSRHPMPPLAMSALGHKPTLPSACLRREIAGACVRTIRRFVVNVCIIC